MADETSVDSAADELRALLTRRGIEPDVSKSPLGVDVAVGGTDHKVRLRPADNGVEICVFHGDTPVAIETMAAGTAPDDLAQRAEQLYVDARYAD
jgi:hypothetical protein